MPRQLCWTSMEITTFWAGPAGRPRRKVIHLTSQAAVLHVNRGDVPMPAQRVRLDAWSAWSPRANKQSVIGGDQRGPVPHPVNDHYWYAAIAWAGRRHTSSRGVWPPMRIKSMPRINAANGVDTRHVRAARAGTRRPDASPRPVRTTRPLRRQGCGSEYALSSASATRMLLLPSASQRPRRPLT